MVRFGLEDTSDESDKESAPPSSPSGRSPPYAAPTAEDSDDEPAAPHRRASFSPGGLFATANGRATAAAGPERMGLAAQIDLDAHGSVDVE